MALENKTLEQILAEGTITAIYIGGNTTGHRVLTSDEVDNKVGQYCDDLFGLWSFTNDLLEYDGTRILKASATSVTIGTGLNAAFLEAGETEITSPVINLTGLSIASIDLADSQSAVTKEWVLAQLP